MAPKDKYTDPELRDQVKEEIHQGDKGGKPGQWSARKVRQVLSNLRLYTSYARTDWTDRLQAQMMASEYKKRGGDYTTDKDNKDESQKHLQQWTEEEWQTKEGSGTARRDDGTRKRYLLKQAWAQMDADQKEETEAKKVEGSKGGKQFVGNTAKAKDARRKAQKDVAAEGGGRRDGPKTRSSDKKEDEEESDAGEGDEKKSAGTKRTAKQSGGSNKKQKEDGRTGKPKGAQVEEGEEDGEDEEYDEDEHAEEDAEEDAEEGAEEGAE
ncbi:uncharacterized protein N7482_007755 [Penicillium canariense]|uniref:Uncharacterized protein n=1 Tax=Penicillium canariense TaxID=189055 RepID=A0A9W9HZN0_9EURO|nr:uncharacterized protein N7482_007755 [Penicillium canariense]KAJ5160751.1 hypothetical protein N7482_007755 [Penicillium canariense]